MKRKNKKERFFLIVFISGFILLCTVVGVILSISREKINNLCIQKLETISDLEGCKYIHGKYEQIKDNIFECSCIKDSRIEKFVVEKNETK